MPSYSRQRLLHAAVLGSLCSRHGTRRGPIVASEPAQRSDGREDHKTEQNRASGEAGDTETRKRAFEVGCPPPEFGIGNERKTGIEGNRIDWIAHQRSRLKMGRQIVNDLCPALPAVDAPIKTVVRRDNNTLPTRGDSIHGCVRLRERSADMAPARAAVTASEQPVASRGPESRGISQIRCEAIGAGGGYPPSSPYPAPRAVDARPDLALDDGEKDLG